jgi:hypothetical protein
MQLCAHNVKRWATCAEALCRLATEDSEVLRLLAVAECELLVEWMDGVGESGFVQG